MRAVAYQTIASVDGSEEYQKETTDVTLALECVKSLRDRNLLVAYRHYDYDRRIDAAYNDDGVRVELSIYYGADRPEWVE
jgi:hypothetical protein